MQVNVCKAKSQPSAIKFQRCHYEQHKPPCHLQTQYTPVTRKQVTPTEILPLSNRPHGAEIRSASQWARQRAAAEQHPVLHKFRHYCEREHAAESSLFPFYTPKSSQTHLYLAVTSHWWLSHKDLKASCNYTVITQNCRAQVLYFIQISLKI